MHKFKIIGLFFLQTFTFQLSYCAQVNQDVDEAELIGHEDRSRVLNNLIQTFNELGLNLELNDENLQALDLKKAKDIFNSLENTMLFKITEDEKNNYNDKCLICFDSAGIEYKTNCNHYFHKDCLIQCFATNITNSTNISCPECRTIFKEQASIQFSKYHKYISQMLSIFLRNIMIASHYYDHALGLPNAIHRRNLRTVLHKDDLKLLNDIANKVDLKRKKLDLVLRNINYNIDLQSNKITIFLNNQKVENLILPKGISDKIIENSPIKIGIIPRLLSVITFAIIISIVNNLRDVDENQRLSYQETAVAIIAGFMMTYIWKAIEKTSEWAYDRHADFISNYVHNHAHNHVD